LYLCISVVRYLDLEFLPDLLESALGGRIRKIVADETALYYYNNRQVLVETDEREVGSFLIFRQGSYRAVRLYSFVWGSHSVSVQLLG
jgi:hypothetical protein